MKKFRIIITFDLDKILSQEKVRSEGWTWKNRTFKKVNTYAFFLGGSLEQSWSCILLCHRLSPLQVWFGQELVRLIALISPWKFFSVNFLMAYHQKFSFFGIFKACINKIAYTSLENTKNENVLTRSHQKVNWKTFSRTSDVSYCSKRWRNWSELSIARNPDRIRRVEATNEECRTTIAPETP